MDFPTVEEVTHWVTVCPDLREFNVESWGYSIRINGPDPYHYDWFNLHSPDSQYVEDDGQVEMRIQYGLYVSHLEDYFEHFIFPTTVEKALWEVEFGEEYFMSVEGGEDADV